MAKMIQIGANYFINESKVLGARVYQKDEIIKVAFTIDAKSTENQVAFSDPCKDVDEAKAVINKFNND